jgi:MoaA/NifB/PqqE/SkfB family radical SAM enzyme
MSPLGLRLFRYLVLQIESTTVCNLDCKICMRRNLGRPASYLSFDNFKSIFDSARFHFVTFHGWGEPLLNPQLFEMIGYAESKGVITELTTNGTLVHQNIDKIFSSGLREIAFGVYNMSLAQQRLPQIEELVKTRKGQGLDKPKIYFDIVVYRGNLGQIPALVNLAAEVGIDAVVLHRLFNVYGVDASIEAASDEEERELFAEVVQLAARLRLELYLPPKLTSPCQVVRHSIFVTAEGKATPCCFLPEFYLGDALSQGVARIMRSREYTTFVKNMVNFHICGRCPYNAASVGGK